MVRVEPLEKSDTKALLILVARELGVTLSNSEADEITEFVGGFPPSTYFAGTLLHLDGPAAILADKHELTRFRTVRFIDHLKRLNLGEPETRLLRFLAAHSPLTWSVLGALAKVDSDILSAAVTKLIDFALVQPADGLYKIAEPVRDAVIRIFGSLAIREHDELAQALFRDLEEEEPPKGRLDLYRVLFRSARLAKNTALADKAYHLASDLIDLTISFYRNEDYATAIEFGYAALEERPTSVGARTHLIRALVREVRWPEAEEQIEILRRYSNRDAAYCTGFLCARSGKFKEAIAAYKECEILGRRDVALYRELAHCELLDGNLGEAERYINLASTREPDNRYVVDLQAQISTRLRNEKEARAALGRLETIDREAYYFRRLS